MTCLLDREQDLRQDIELDSLNKEVVSPWRNPILMGENETTPVVVYFYSHTWIPMKCFSLAEAIALYHKGLPLGKEIIVYPPDVDPYTHRIATPPCVGGVE